MLGFFGKLFFGFLAAVVLLAILGFFLVRRDKKMNPSAREEDPALLSERAVGNVQDLNDRFNRPRYMDQDGK